MGPGRQPVFVISTWQFKHTVFKLAQLTLVVLLSV
jgi:hypothetical protein